jgi:hypothetical protein
MEKAVKIKFTKTEVEILDHRLTVPDALADALEDDGHEHDEVMGMARSLQRRFAAGDTEFDTGTCSPVALAILVDCCDGSTFFGSAEDVVVSGSRYGLLP